MSVIINADDFGISPAVNDGILYCLQWGIISQTTLMVNMPACFSAVKKAKNQKLFNKVGLHLNLTEGIPLTENIKNYECFCDKKGFFNGNIKNSFQAKISYSYKNNAALREEIIAQIERFLSLHPRLMHIDSHHHVHTYYGITRILIPLAREYGFNSMRISRITDNTNSMVRHYKYIINKIISSSFSVSNLFGSYGDYSRSNFRDNCLYEIMVHPIMETNKVFDRVSMGKNMEKKLISEYELPTTIFTYPCCHKDING